jgi:hypothetical protein
MRGRFDFEFGNGMLCFMDIGYMMVDILCLEQGFWELGAPYLAVVDGIYCEKRGSDVHLLHIVLTLPRSHHLHYSPRIRFFSTLVSSASIVVGLWQKNSCAL